MTSSTPGLRARGSAVVRLSLALMVAIFIGGAIFRVATGHHARTVTATGAVYEFYASPAKVSCEFDRSGSSPAGHEIYCEFASFTFASHVTMNADGVIHVCHGANCGSNAGLNTPTFLAPTRVVSDPIACTVLRVGVTCQLPSGVGFTMTPTSIVTLK